VNRIESKIEGLAKKMEKATSRPVETVGAAVGRAIGHKDLGRRIGRAAGRFIGTGDYEVHYNSLIPSQRGSGPTVVRDGAAFEPVVRNRGRAVIVSNREFLGDVVAPSGTFANTTYRINPADVSTFPWLADVAAHYEQWRPLGMVFEYRPTSSAYNGTNQELGVVIMATDYDASDLQYQSKREMENSAYANSAPPHKHLVHGIECDPRQRAVDYFYVAPTAATAAADQRQQTLGNFQIATYGVSGTDVSVGELWVSYEIEFIKTTIPSTLPRLDDFHGTSTIATGTALSTLGGSRTASVYSFPPSLGQGNFLIVQIRDGGTPTAGAPVLANCVIKNPDGVSTRYVGSGTLMYAWFGVQITEPGATITFAGTEGTAHNWLLVTPLPTDLRTTVT
jgi:hypothetical protein